MLDLQILNKVSEVENKQGNQFPACYPKSL